MKFEIEPYKTINGRVPVDEFLESLDKNHLEKVMTNIGKLEERGNMLRMPLSKPMGNGLFELRTIFEDGISRVFYFFYVGRKVILTHGFIKKTEKTPLSEIDRATRYKNDYLKRNGGK